MTTTTGERNTVIKKKGQKGIIPIQKPHERIPISRASLIPQPQFKDLDIDNFSIPIATSQKMLPYQDAAIRRMLRFFVTNGMKGVYNGYEPGLGKSMMAITLAANIFKSKKILVGCPPGLVGNWADEIRKWDIDNTSGVLTVNQIRKSRDALRYLTAKWTICGYSLFLSENVFRRLDEMDWDFIIFDEAKDLKSSTAKRTRLAQALWNNTRRGLWMDGTPMTKSAQDLYVPCNVMMPEHYTSEDEFCERYCLRRTTPWGYQGWEYFSGQNLEELGSHMRENFFVRKKKEEVLLDLPPTTYQKISLDCGAFDKKLTEEQERTILEAIKEGKDPNLCAKPQDKKHISERRLEAGIKTLAAATDIIGTYVEGKIPLMVVAYHTAVINAVMDMYKKFNPVKIDGSVVGAAKDRARDAFNNGQSDLIVLQIRSAVGINLHYRCSNAIYAELSYDPTQILQSLDRLRRIGQHSSVNAMFLVAAGSVDEQIFDILKQKLQIIEQTIKSTDE